MKLKAALLLITTMISCALGSSLRATVFAGQLSIPPPDLNDTTGVVNRGALGSFFQQLAAAENSGAYHPVRIIHYGDSHTKADLFTGAVRASLQRDFGNGSRLVKKTSYRPVTAAGESIIYEALGVNGARAKRLRTLTDTSAFLQSLAQSNPDLIVIAYGTNEVTDDDWTTRSYEGMLAEIITRLRSAAPAASVLVLGPPDRAVFGPGGWTSAGRMPALIDAQRRAARDAGAAFWSAYDAMGGDGSMNAWVARGLARPDHVHLTAVGYHKLAGMFYRDLMNAYRAHTSGRSFGVANPGFAPDSPDLRVMRGVPVNARRPK